MTSAWWGMVLRYKHYTLHLCVCVATTGWQDWILYWAARPTTRWRHSDWTVDHG